MTKTTAQRKRHLALLHEMIVEYRLDEALRRTAAPVLTTPTLPQEVIERILELEMDLERLLFFLEKETTLSASSFDLLWSWAHSEIWIVRRERDVAHLTKRGRALKTLTKGMPREDLEAWALARGLSCWLDVPLVAFTQMFEYMRFALDVSPQSALLWASVGDALDPAHHVRLDSSLQGWFAEEARRRLREYAKQATTQPLSPALRASIEDPERAEAAHPKLEPVLQSALKARATMARQAALLPEVFVSRYTSLKLDDLSNHLELTARCEAPCGAHPSPTHVHLDLNEPPYAVLCSCVHNPQRACPLKLMALDQFLEVLLKDTSPKPTKARLDLVSQIVSTLGVPTWRRQVDRVMRALDPEALLPEELSGMPAWLGWCIKGEFGYDMTIYPAMVRHKKRGAGVIAKRLHVTLDHLEEVEDPAERARLKLWLSMHQYASSSPSWADELLLLPELVGHPHVYQQDSTSTPCEVSSEDIKLHAGPSEEGDDDGSVEMRFYVGQERLGEAQLERIRREMHESGVMVASFRVDKDRAKLKLWRVSRRVLKALESFSLSQIVLPKTAVEYLVEGVTSSRGAQRDVELHESLRGERVEAHDLLLVRLSFRARVFSLELRAQALEGGASHHPGDGPRTIYATREASPIFAERDLGAEVQRATELLEELGIAYDHGALMTYQSDDAQRSLEIIEQLRELAASKGRVRLVWDTKPVQASRETESSRLTLKLSITKRLLRLGGELKLDQGSVPIEQLLAAAREQQRWVEVGEHQWIKLDASLKRDLERIALLSPGGELSALASPALLQLREQGVTLEGPPEWLTMLDAIEQARELTVELPQGLAATLRPYQVEGFEWMARLAHWAPGACLADDMGLGKTVQALALLLRRAEQGAALVVAPTSLGFNWAREAERFAPALKLLRVRSGAEASTLKSALKERGGLSHQVVVASYDLVARNLEHFDAIAWHTLVLDEAQAIKNSATKRARAIHALEVPFTLALTGTPLENHTGELWSLMRALVPGLLGSKASFRERFQLPIERDHDPAARATLSMLATPFILRRLKGQVAQDLPSRSDVLVDVELGDKERRLYDELHRALLIELADPKRRARGEQADQGAEAQQRFQILAAITRLRQAACHPKLYLESTKLKSTKLAVLTERLVALKEEGYRALVFSQFTSLLKLAREELEQAGLSVAYLDGSLSAKGREQAVEAFQAGEHDAFLLSIKAGGVGLNLTAASSVFLLDPWWNPAVEDQATDRAHRIGQSEPVTVYRLVSRGTIEESIYALHAEKRALLDGVLGEHGAVSKALSAEDLRALLEHVQGEV